MLQEHFAAGSRVVAVATRDADGQTSLTAADEYGLRLAGFLVFLDPPKAGAAASLRRLADLGITVKICTGDNALVAAEGLRRPRPAARPGPDRRGHRGAGRRRS